MLNSAFDPLLYAAIRKPVRKGYIEIIKWTTYCMLCFAPWLKPKNNFGMHNKCRNVCIYICISVDEVLGLKNSNRYTQNGAEQNKKLNHVSKVTQASDTSLNIECKHVTEVLARITDTVSNNTREVNNTSAATTINLSVVQEVTIVKQDNKTDD